MLKEFKKFILRGNVVDLAVGVVIGAAFGAVVTALVNDFIKPLITGFTGGQKGVQGVAEFHIGKHLFTFPWGDFITALISFLAIAAVIFFCVVQPINKLQSLANRNKVPAEPTDRKCPECLSSIPKAASRCAFCTAKVTPVTR
jgi:large conductance mechanosensitive channel